MSMSPRSYFQFENVCVYVWCHPLTKPQKSQVRRRQMPWQSGSSHMCEKILGKHEHLKLVNAHHTYLFACAAAAAAAGVINYQ